MGSKTGNEIRKFNTGEFLSNIGWSPDGKFLVIGALVVLDAQTGREIHRLMGHYGAVTNVVWSPRGDRIASSSSDGTIIIWEIGGH